MESHCTSIYLDNVMSRTNPRNVRRRIDHWLFASVEDKLLLTKQVLWKALPAVILLARAPPVEPPPSRTGWLLA